MFIPHNPTRRPPFFPVGDNLISPPGKQHTINIEDARLARIVRASKDIPGYQLFQYFDDNDQRQGVDSGDVNAYLREITGEDFSAKDFRTWGGTVLAAIALHELGACKSETEAKTNINAAIKQVAGKLGNTPAMCRKYYIHPAVLECYTRGDLIDLLEERLSQNTKRTSTSLDPEEEAVVAILQQETAKASTAA